MLPATYTEDETMKKLYPNIYLFCLVISLPIISANIIAQENDNLTLNSPPVILDELAQSTGLGGITIINSKSNIEAALTGNSANNNTTGSNIIDQGSFRNAGGVFSVIQNTGNNVIIQDSTVITVTITPN